MVLCALRAFFVRFVFKYNIIPMNVTWYKYFLKKIKDTSVSLILIARVELFYFIYAYFSCI